MAIFSVFTAAVVGLFMVNSISTMAIGQHQSQVHSRLVRSLDLNSMISGLATQFFQKGGQSGVNELSTSQDKPNVLQKYLGGSLLSSILGGAGGGSQGAGTGTASSGGGGFNLNNPMVQQLIQMIMAKFSGGGGASAAAGSGAGARTGLGAGLGGGGEAGGDAAPLQQSMPMTDGQQQPKKSSGGGAGAALLKAVAKQLMKS